MILRADDHYRVVRKRDGCRRDQIEALACIFCPFEVGVFALHRVGDRSGAGRYCRARARMVKHIHAEHVAHEIAEPPSGVRVEGR